MYEFLSGPGLWIAFILFFGGTAIRATSLYQLSRVKDKVVYNHVNWGWGLKSIFYWMVPWVSASTRRQPMFAFVVFLFHICLIATPLFLNAHNILWDENLNLKLWSIPNWLADMLTVALIFSGIFLLVRRFVRPEVRILTGLWDYALLGMTMLPFLTGFLAYHQWGHYETSLILHMLSGELLLVMIPFTKLGHAFLFFFTRVFIGFEMGGRRGARSW
jgi:nitrate reductase gamma subunit